MAKLHRPNRVEGRAATRVTGSRMQEERHRRNRPVLSEREGPQRPLSSAYSTSLIGIMR